MLYLYGLRHLINLIKHQKLSVCCKTPFPKNNVPLKKLISITMVFGRIMILILLVTAVRLWCVVKPWYVFFGCHGNHYYQMTLISQSLRVWSMFILPRWQSLWCLSSPFCFSSSLLPLSKNHFWPKNNRGFTFPFRSTVLLLAQVGKNPETATGTTLTDTLAQ